ncbi:Uncharacterised protein [Mycobacteroides abscessus subsp. abscessus]|nr:Uncharacterised protein [Mycobacteroides abscessus subsp. abscessus]
MQLPLPARILRVFVRITSRHAGGAVVASGLDGVLDRVQAELGVHQGAGALSPVTILTPICRSASRRRAVDAPGFGASKKTNNPANRRVVFVLGGWSR